MMGSTMRSIFILLLSFTGIVSGFRSFYPTKTIVRMSNLHMNAVADVVFSGIREPLQQQLDLAVPIMQSWNLPQFVIQWGHPIAMSTALFLVLGAGMFFGIRVKRGKGNEKYWFTLGKTVREQHPVAMTIAFLSFYAGSTGGISALAAQGKSILDSPHAVTAVAAMALMAVQALTPLAIPSGGKIARKVHSAMGMMLVTLLLLNAYFGLNLGLSLNPAA